MTKLKAALHNLGCKVNSYELEAAAQMLRERGYDIVPFAPGADIYIINTCSVTNIADRKSRQMLHKAKNMNKDALVIAMGCYAQTDTKTLEEDSTVDIIVGNNRKIDLGDIIDQYAKDRKKKEYVEDLSRERNYEQLSVNQPGEHIRGFMKVQDGCDQFCSYCIIPYARGRVRSRSLQECVSEAEKLAASGCAEIVLSGIHLSSYGRDLKKEAGLLELIRAIHKIEGIERIRLGSLEQGIISEEFAQNLSTLPKLCPHFHLSLQSGCSKTLKAMNRRYSAEEFEQKCQILRKYFENPSITTDVITGFPGESEKDFQESYDFVKKIRFFETHIFPYSKRKGTKAADMPGQLTEAEKKERAARLIALNQKVHKKFLEKNIGQKMELLIEEEQEIYGEKYWIGHSKRYEKAAVRSKENLRNKIIEVKALSLLGEDCILAEALQTCNI